jgi:hypothetical protein
MIVIASRTEKRMIVTAEWLGPVAGATIVS